MAAITEVACWSHCRRRIFDAWERTKSTIAKAALDQIAQLYAVADKARFAPPAERLEHRAAVIPLLDAFFAWAQAAERKLSARSELAEACGGPEFQSCGGEHWMKGGPESLVGPSGYLLMRHRSTKARSARPRMRQPIRAMRS
jgi:hypothetical protein